MKVHAGVDKDLGMILSEVATGANLHDFTPADELLHGDEVLRWQATEFRVAIRPGNRRAQPDTPK